MGGRIDRWDDRLDRLDFGNKVPEELGLEGYELLNHHYKNVEEAMPFPVGPLQNRNETEKLFPVHDPLGLRKAITPVFVGHRESGVMRGCGTSFFITPFGRQLSAMHVITDFFNDRQIKVLPNTTSTFSYTDAMIQILHDPGLFWGTRPAGTILHASDFVMFPVDQSANPLAIVMGANDLMRVEPSLDLVAWNIQSLGERKTNYLPLCLGRQRPGVQVGDRVLALGYPQNHGERENGRQIATYREEMCGSIAKVIEIRTEWDQSKKRWPSIIVDTHWPPGMSGGPVFDEDGNVVGIVSRGADDYSEALWLQQLPYARSVYGDVDPDNPGWVIGWGVSNSHSLLELFSTEAAAREFADGCGAGVLVQRVSTPYRLGLGNWIANPGAC